MRPLDYVAQRPLLVLGLVAAAFLSWVVIDATSPKPKTNPPPAPAEVPMTSDVQRMHSVGLAVHNVQLGTPRADVEQTLGPPAPRDIRPVERSNGRVVYRIHYPAVLAVPLPLSPRVQGQCELVLEYDASSPGHPLLRILAVSRGAPHLPTIFAIAV